MIRGSNYSNQTPINFMLLTGSEMFRNITWQLRKTKLVVHAYLFASSLPRSGRPPAGLGGKSTAIPPRPRPRSARTGSRPCTRSGPATWPPAAAASLARLASLPMQFSAARRETPLSLINTVELIPLKNLYLGKVHKFRVERVIIVILSPLLFSESN